MKILIDDSTAKYAYHENFRLYGMYFAKPANKNNFSYTYLRYCMGVSCDHIVIVPSQV